jgi:hypothetical protein
MNHEGVQYSVDEALVMAMTTCQFNKRMEIPKAHVAHQFLPTYSLKRAMQSFVNKDMMQLLLRCSS